MIHRKGETSFLVVLAIAILFTLIVQLGQQMSKVSLLQSPSATEYLQSVVLVYDVDGPVGSGVLIDARTVVTARHLLAVAPIHVVDSSGTALAIEVTVGDNDSDGAILYLETPSLCLVADVACSAPPIGASTTTFGLLGGYGTVKGAFRGNVVAVGALVPFPGVVLDDMLIVDSHTIPGCSGGPVFVDGKVIGIHTGGDGNLGAVTPLANFVELLPQE